MTLILSDFLPLLSLSLILSSSLPLLAPNSEPATNKQRLSKNSLRLMVSLFHVRSAVSAVSNVLSAVHRGSLGKFARRRCRRFAQQPLMCIEPSADKEEDEVHVEQQNTIRQP